MPTLPPLQSEEELDSLITAEMEKRHIPGAALTVVREGKRILTRTYGCANLEWNLPTTLDTVFEIGSITKTFTAALVVLLAEDGLLGLDDAITGRLEGLPESWAGITVRHLLCHQSGIPNYTSVGDFIAIARTDYTHAEIIGMVADLPLEFAPGAQFAYCNTGFHLLGQIIERVSGESFWELLDRRILKPLEMTRTRSTEAPAVVPHRAQGYTWGQDCYRNADVLTTTAGFSAGALLSTLDDLVKWDAAMVHDRVVSRARRDEMWTGAPDNDGKPTDYGLGWGVGETKGHRFVAHGGGTPGFGTMLIRYLEDDLALVLLTNRGGGDIGKIVALVAGYYIPELLPTVYEPIEDTEPEVAEVVRDYYARGLTGDWDEAAFTPEVWTHLQRLNADRVKEYFQSLGALQSLTLVERTDKDEKQIHRYRAVFDSMTQIVTLTRTAEGRIAGIGGSQE